MGVWDLDVSEDMLAPDHSFFNTYEEARTVALSNQDSVTASKGPLILQALVLLGGTCVHNTSSCVMFHRLSSL